MRPQPRPQGAGKKLRGAVRHHLTSGSAQAPSAQEQADLDDQWRALGGDPQRIAQARAEADADEEAGQEREWDDPDNGPIYELWPENEEAWDVFTACATQWRLVVGLGGAAYQGLDYGAVDMVMTRHRIRKKHWRQVLTQIRIAENEALKHLNEKPNE